MSEADANPDRSALSANAQSVGEPFSYTAPAGGYSEDFYNSEEVLSFSAFADASEVTDVRPESYGDKIVRELSPKSSVTRLSHYVKLPENTVIYAFAAIYMVVGIVCVSIPVAIISVLPYIVGGMMILIGAVRFIIALVTKEYRQLTTNRTATSLILTALGIMIIIQHFRAENDAAITFIAIVWGILGLFEGAYAFNRAFKRIAHAERAVFYILKGLVEVVVAFLLLYDPTNHDTHNLHIIVFGCNLILDSVTMLPFVKKFFNE